MSEFKGTKGPWFVDNHGDVNDRPDPVSEDMKCIAACRGLYDIEADMHNANLIAAAPELLEALQDALHAYDKHGEHSEWDFARAAVAKALGQ